MRGSTGRTARGRCGGGGGPSSVLRSPSNVWGPGRRRSGLRSLCSSTAPVTRVPQDPLCHPSGPPPRFSGTPLLSLFFVAPRALPLPPPRDRFVLSEVTGGSPGWFSGTVSGPLLGYQVTPGLPQARGRPRWGPQPSLHLTSHPALGCSPGGGDLAFPRRQTADSRQGPAFQGREAGAGQRPPAPPPPSLPQSLLPLAGRGEVRGLGGLGAVSRLQSAPLGKGRGGEEEDSKDPSPCEWPGAGEGGPEGHRRPEAGVQGGDGAGAGEGGDTASPRGRRLQRRDFPSKLALPPRREIK